MSWHKQKISEDEVFDLKLGCFNLYIARKCFNKACKVGHIQIRPTAFVFIITYKAMPRIMTIFIDY